MINKMHYRLIFGLIFILLPLFSCAEKKDLEPYVIILGIAQDGGAPQAGCDKNCCVDRWGNPEKKLNVSSLGIVDPATEDTWIIDVTPDFPAQLKTLNNNKIKKLKGAFLTHAHTGHYTGLIHLGREAMGAKNIPVFVMPKMQNYLKSNGPWSQLIKLKNIKIKSLKNEKKINLNPRISITPFLVPHRDEFSETVGYRISGPNNSFIYIPDIDKWNKWDKNLQEIVAQNDYLFLDGTFAEKNELPGRNMSEIPHPFIVETMELLKDVKNKSKIYFIHLNHTNTALMPNSQISFEMKELGFRIAKYKEKFKL